MVLISRDKQGQPLLARYWGCGFLPSNLQGAGFRSGQDPVLYLSNPAGIDATSRRKMLDRLQELHAVQLARSGDQEVDARIAQYELAFRMQSSWLERCAVKQIGI